MGRTVDQDVHQAFVEFRAKEDDKCLSVQCIYCQQIRAKNTSRQKQHLLECPGLRGHPNAPQPPQNAPTSLPASNTYGTPTGPGQSALPGSNGPLSLTVNSVNGVNGVGPHSTPLPNITNRPSLTGQSSAAGPSATTPQAQRASTAPKTPKTKSTPNSNLPAPPLDDVHAAFVEFRAKEEDKCLSVQCIYCNQIRAKNTSRQRQHLLECPTYLNVMKDSIPANNLLHTFPEGDVARSLQIPQPTLELDFRMSVKLNPAMNLGSTMFGQKRWVSFVGGQWAGRWGKGIVIPGGQDAQTVVKDGATKLETTYLLQTTDEPPAFLQVKTNGWRTGAKDVLEKLENPATADTVNPSTYKFRLTIQLETGDERYGFVNTCIWVGSGCRRGGEVIYDAYRIT